MRTSTTKYLNLFGILFFTVMLYFDCFAQTPTEIDTMFHPGYYSNSPVTENGDLVLTALSGTSWVWTGPNGFSSTSANNIITNVSSSNAGTYYLTLNDSINDTTYYYSIIVSVTPSWSNQIHIQFDWTDICDNTPTQFWTPQVNQAIYAWSATPGGVNISNPAISDPVITFPTAQNPVVVYTVTLVITVNGVSNTYNQNVNINHCCTDPPPSGFPLGAGKLLLKDLTIAQVVGLTNNFLSSPFPIKIAIKGALTLATDWTVNSNQIIKDITILPNSRIINHGVEFNMSHVDVHGCDQLWSSIFTIDETEP